MERMTIKDLTNKLKVQFKITGDLPRFISFNGYINDTRYILGVEDYINYIIENCKIKENELCDVNVTKNILSIYKIEKQPSINDLLDQGYTLRQIQQIMKGEN